VAASSSRRSADADRRGRVAGGAHEARDVAAVGGQVGEHLVGVGGQALQRAAVVGEDPQHAVGLAQRRHAAADRRLQVVAAGAQALAELGQDDPEALARGAAEDVEHDVRRDRAGGLLDGDRPRRGLRRGAAVAVEEVLADQRLRLDLAEDVPAKAREARLVDPHGRQRARGRALDVEVGDPADVDAVGAQVGVLGQPEGVVEHDRVAVAVALAGPRGRDGERGGGARGEQRQEDRERSPHGPIGTCEGSQLKSGDGL
jgi:hypothetical protein